MICPQCSHWITPPGKTCSHCGNTVGAKPRPTQTPPASPENPSSVNTAPAPTVISPEPFPSPGMPQPVSPQPTYPAAPEADDPALQKPSFWTAANKQTAAVLGGVAVVLIAVFSALGFFRNHPFIFIGAIFLLLVVGFPVAIVLVEMLGGGKAASRCYICNNSLSDHVFKWQLDGESRRVCAHCNQSLKRKNSSEAMKRRTAGRK